MPFNIATGFYTLLLLSSALSFPMGVPFRPEPGAVDLMPRHADSDPVSKQPTIPQTAHSNTYTLSL